MNRTGIDVVNVSKLGSFDGSEFTSWKRKVQFGMKYLEIFYTVEDMAGTVDEDRWTKDEDFCREYILNCLSDRLAEVYSRYPTAKEIWDNLEAQFKREEELSKTHLVDKFMGFKFDEEKEVLPQVTDLENLVLKMKHDNIPICDTFLAGAIVFKLPSSWLSFKTEMLRKKNQVGLDDLKRCIKIEDETRTRNKLEMIGTQVSTANMVQSQQVQPIVAVGPAIPATLHIVSDHPSSSSATPPHASA